ncbi:MAG: glycosyltransferase [bacterium]|nr:glycosyltransferase [bacterium]
MTSLRRDKPTVLFISYNGALEPILQSQGLPYLRGLSARGIHVVLLSFERPAMATPERLNTLRRSLAERGITWVALKYHKRPRLLATLFDIVRGASATAALVRRHDVAVIHARSYVPALMAWLVTRWRRIPWLFDMRGLMAEEYADGGLINRYGLLYRFIKIAEIRLLRDADHIIVLTEAVRGTLLDDAGIWSRGGPAPMSVIPCCTDLERFTPRATAPERPPLERTEGPHIIYVGSVGTWYCMEEMIAFVAVARGRWPALRWTILTHGDHDVIRAGITKMGLPAESVTLKAVPPEAVPGELAAADVGIAFILPVNSKRASCPTKLGEYLACGLPVVINAGIGDTQSLIERHKVGVVVKALEPSAYHLAIAELEKHLQDPGLTARCRRAAEEELALSQGVERYIQAYEQLDVSVGLEIGQ